MRSIKFDAALQVLALLVLTSSISMALSLQQTVSLSSLQALARLLPKAELHAHLHGSIRLSTLQELAHSKQVSLPKLAVAEESAVPSLDICFGCFDAIHQIADNLPTLQRIAHEAFEDFANDGVLYCELRSTPRALHDGTSKRDYVIKLLEVQVRSTDCCIYSSCALMMYA
jgi:adenosine deaminase